MRTKIKSAIVILCLLLVPSLSFSQIYSQKDIINQYDPFTITLNDLSLNTNDEDFREHYFLIMVTIYAGNEKIVKFLTRDDLIMNSVKSYDNFWNINFTVKRNNVIIMPAFINITNSPNSVTMKFEGYSNINEGDQALVNQLSTSFCYTSSGMYNLMDRAFKYLASSPDVNRPNNSMLVTAEVLQQNLAKRPEIFYMGDPAEVTYVIPNDPKKVLGTNLLVQGPRGIDSKVSLRVLDRWNITVTKLTDVNIVKGEPYYTKIKGVFNDITGLQKISDLKVEGYLARANEVINDDLVMGRKADVYLNDQVVKQFTNLMNLLKAGLRVKADTAEITTDFMKSDEREALSYFETNIRDNDFNLDNEYLFDDYVNSSVNRGIIQREIDLIRKYYEIK